VRQSDYNSRDTVSYTYNYEIEQMDTEDDSDNWDDETELDEDLKSDIGRG